MNAPEIVTLLESFFPGRIKSKKLDALDPLEIHEHLVRRVVPPGHLGLEGAGVGGVLPGLVIVAVLQGLAGLLDEGTGVLRVGRGRAVRRRRKPPFW